MLLSRFTRTLAHAKIPKRDLKWSTTRLLSTTPPTVGGNTAPPDVQVNPPSALTKDMAVGIQDSIQLFMRHGLGKQRLNLLSKEAGDVNTLVTRWQRMMEAYLGTQVHVLAGLGYTPNETGLQQYNQHLAMYMQGADPATQENLRVTNRDLWRFVLSSAFDVPIEDINDTEMNIVDARNAMHQVSQKMIEPSTLEGIAQKCSLLKTTGNAAMDMAQKHQVVQEALVHDVYLGGEPTLLETLGFESNEKGYVSMQCVMAEHQSDPLVAQYIGSAMIQILKTAGIDMSEVQKAAGGQ